jgi:hypothetical protein
MREMATHCFVVRKSRVERRDHEDQRVRPETQQVLPAPSLVSAGRREDDQDFPGRQLGTDLNVASPRAGRLPSSAVFRLRREVRHELKRSSGRRSRTACCCTYHATGRKSVARSPLSNGPDRDALSNGCGCCRFPNPNAYSSQASHQKMKNKTYFLAALLGASLGAGLSGCATNSGVGAQGVPDWHSALRFGEDQILAKQNQSQQPARQGLR